jgi:hypothetical protein
VARKSKTSVRAGSRPPRRTARRGAASAPGTARGTRTAAAPAAAPRIARVARGKRPQYFSDPAIDKLLSMTLTLMEELSVTRDRLDTVERLLESRRVLERGKIESFAPDARATAERGARRTAYVDRVLRAAQAELEEVTRRDMPRTEDEVVEAVAS